MKRKLIALGDGCLVMSIPSKYVKRHGFKKGDQIDVIDQGGELIVSAESVTGYAKEREIVLDPEGTKRYVESNIINAYKNGYDKLVVRYSSPEHLKYIRSSLNEVIGYQIVDAKDGAVIIRNVAKINLSELPNMLRRTFLVLLSVAGTVVGEENTGVDMHDEIKSLNESIKKLTTVLKRMLVIRLKHEDDALFRYMIVRDLEKIANEYMYISRRFEEDSQVSEEVFKLLVKTKDMLRHYYDCFYKKDKLGMGKLTRIKDELLWKESYGLLTSSAPAERIIVHHTANIIRRIYDLHGPFLSMEADK